MFPGNFKIIESNIKVVMILQNKETYKNKFIIEV